MTRKFWSALLIATALAAPATVQAAEWWRIGQQTDGDWVFIDAASIDDGFGEMGFSGMFVYATPFTMDNGEVLQYEAFTAYLDCDAQTLTNTSRSFYRANRTLVTSVEDDTTDPVNPNQATGWEAAFVCDNERGGGSHSFQPISGEPY